jgi:neutral ceramidase
MKAHRTTEIIIILIILIPGFSFGQSSSSGKAAVKLGVSQINITPLEPVMMSGYDARKTPSTGVHDDLYASALCFSDGATRILLITTDLIGFRSGIADDMKQMISSGTGIPPENIMITAVHNHGGPSVKTYESSLPEANESYMELLYEKLLQLAVEASENLVPFQMGIGKSSCDMNINRRAEFADGAIWLGRNPGGPCDHELDVVQLKDLNNNTLAVLLNWPCHATANGQENYRITGDWPGAAARYIKKELGNETVVAITVGASADINPIYGPGNNFNEIEAIGYHVGKNAAKTFAGTETFPVNSLEIQNVTLTLPGKMAGKDHFPPTSYEKGPDVEIRLTVLKVGELIICGISGELMTEIGMEIKKLSPYSGTLVVTHCNGSSGYICTDNAFQEGGYEIKVTKLMPGAEPIITRKYQELIHAF